MPSIKEKMQGWGRAHRGILMVVLVLILVAVIAYGTWIMIDIQRWKAEHPPATLTIEGFNVSSGTFEPLCTNLFQVDLYNHGYEVEKERRQGATAAAYNLTMEEARAVVVYMGDWKGGPVLSEWGVDGFTSRGPDCIPSFAYHPEEYRIGG